MNDYNLIYDTYAEYNSAHITTRFGEQFDTGKDVWAEAPTGSGKTAATSCFTQCFN
jgi:Rad3-related DNA helicase